MKFEIKNRFNGNLIFSIETDSWKLAIEAAIKVKLDLRSADLSSADLSYANLRSANLRSANLSYANLSYANLSYVNLSSANLSYANLSYANLIYVDLSSADLSYVNLRSANLSYANLSCAVTDKKYIQIACIGSRKGMTTYCFDDDEIFCGCFRGTLKEFEKEVKETHKDNEQYLKEYLGFIKYLKAVKGRK